MFAVEADDRRHYEAAAQAVKALTLVKEHHRHEAVLAAEADERRRHEAAARAVEPKTERKPSSYAAGDGDGQRWRRRWAAAATAGGQPRHPPFSSPLKRFRLLRLHSVRNL